MTTLSHMAELTRTYSRHRYLCTLFAPQDVREAWFALFAFEQEIASIAHKVSEEMVGFVRYAWWRETLKAIVEAKPPRGHPVAEALAQVVAKHHLPGEPFERIIDAHEKALADKQPVDAAFLEATSVPLMELCATAAKTEAITTLAVAIAAIEAALLPHTTPEHKAEFAALARTKLALAKPVSDVFSPFAHMVEFYLGRFERARPITQADTRLWLPLKLWQKQGITC